MYGIFFRWIFLTKAVVVILSSKRVFTNLYVWMNGMLKYGEAYGALDIL